MQKGQDARRKGYRIRKEREESVTCLWLSREQGWDGFVVEHLQSEYEILGPVSIIYFKEGETEGGREKRREGEGGMNE